MVEGVAYTAEESAEGGVEFHAVSAAFAGDDLGVEFICVEGDGTVRRVVEGLVSVDECIGTARVRESLRDFRRVRLSDDAS